VRNLFMAIVIPLMAFSCRRRVAAEDGGRCESVNVLSLLPLFILGFVGMAILRSIGDATVLTGRAFGLLEPAAWGELISVVQAWAGNFLAMAMAGVGLGTGLSQLKGLGLRPFYAGLGAALAVGALSLLGITLLGAFGLH